MQDSDRGHIFWIDRRDHGVGECDTTAKSVLACGRRADAVYDAIASTLPKGAARVAHASQAGQMLHPSRGGGSRPHQGHAQAQLEVHGRHPEARPASSSTEMGMRLPPKMTPAQIAEAQRMAREWKRLGVPGKSRSECALDKRAAPREGYFARPTEPAGAPYEVGRCPGPACPEPL